MCFDYEPDTGALTWRERPQEHFRNRRGWAIWNGRYPGLAAGSRRKDGYILVNINKNRFYIHRVIWKWMTGEEPLATVDHKDVDPSDNRWAQLRNATKQQNQQNHPLSTANKTGFKGVHKVYHRFQAFIRVDGRSKYLGTFATAEEAHAVYCAAAIEIHGRFARFK